MAVKIRLLRMGKIRNPQYRIVVADSRTKRDGRAIEYVGIYQPKEDPSIIEVKSERVQYWLSVGAQPSEAVQRLLEKTGDWQKFKGLPAPPPLLMAAEQADRMAAYEAEAKAAAGLAEATAGASRPRRPPRRRPRPTRPTRPRRRRPAEGRGAGRGRQDPTGAGAGAAGLTGRSGPRWSTWSRASSTTRTTSGSGWSTRVAASGSRSACTPRTSARSSGGAGVRPRRCVR